MAIFKVSGDARLERRLTTMPTRVLDEVEDEIKQIGEDLKRESVALAPFRPNEDENPQHLRMQAYTDPSRTNNSVHNEIGYDGPQDYLLVQHEGGWLNYRGEYGPKRIENYTTPGTGPKFLESPFAENKDNYKRRLRAAAKRGMNG